MNFRFVILIALVWVLGVNAYINAADAYDETEAEHKEQEGHQEDEDAHDEHEGHDEDIVRLSAEEQNTFGIETAVVGPGRLDVHVSLPGEVVVNPDRFAHIVPRVSGMVRSVHKNLGDRVRAGDVMAVLESRELSDVKSAFLGAKERERLALVTFGREDKLWQDGISSEREFLAAKQMLAEARIVSQSAKHKLHALGFSDAYLKTLPEQSGVSYTQYEIVAPFDGIVVAKHITLGENLKDDAEVYSVADLSSVWVMLTVYQKDLAYLKLGDVVHISTQEGSGVSEGSISYISPIIDEATRTATARVVLGNEDGQWRPGLFVNGKVATGQQHVGLLVQRSALQMVENKTSVFVLTGEGFRPHPVVIGRSTADLVEIVDGLKSGHRYVIKGAFTLKAQLEKGAFDDGHNH